MTVEGRIFACNSRCRGMGLEEDEERSNRRRPLGWLSARYCGRNAVTLLSPCPLLLTRFVMLSRRDPPSGNHRTAGDLFDPMAFSPSSPFVRATDCPTSISLLAIIVSLPSLLPKSLLLSSPILRSLCITQIEFADEDNLLSSLPSCFIHRPPLFPGDDFAPF